MTIKEIAKLAGVSIATVSRVINNSGAVKPETEEKIKKIIEDINYVPNSLARSLSTKKSDTIGVVFPNINNPFFGEIIKGITMQADNMGLNIIFLNTCNDFKKEQIAIMSLKKHQIAGLIMTPLSENNAETYSDILESLNVPLILVDREIRMLPCDGVFAENEKASYMLTTSLLENSHKRIALICCPYDTKPGRERLIGYKTALKENNIEFDENIIFFGDFTWQSGYEIMKKIIHEHKDVTGVFVANNMMAVGALKAISEEGMSVPDDIAMVGFDDIEILAILNKGITCAQSPTQSMGTTAVRLIKEKIDSKDNSTVIEKIVLPPEMRDRKTQVFPKNRMN